MNIELNKLIKAMERGWKRVPKMCYGFFEHRRVWKSKTNVGAACAMGHALLGNDTIDINNLIRMFPILQTQKVTGVFYFNPREQQPLEQAINVLVLKGWKTPDIVKWLKTHLDD